MGLSLTIGDGIVDLIRGAAGREEWHPGGAGLNLAVGLSRLGHRSVFASCIGADRNGFRVARYLRDEGVRLINTPSADFTGVALSERTNGEPQYSFNAAMLRRRIGFTDAVLETMQKADAVVVNSFAFEKAQQAKALLSARKSLKGLFLMDPNLRPRLAKDINAFRRGFEANVSGCFMLKLSMEDMSLMYGDNESEALGRLRTLGAERVLLTRGPHGASLVTADNKTLHVSATVSGDEVVDTMGAGDATLAAVIDWLLRTGQPGGVEAWQDCLEWAMRIAGATCTRAGGALVQGAGN